VNGEDGRAVEAKPTPLPPLSCVYSLTRMDSQHSPHLCQMFAGRCRVFAGNRTLTCAYLISIANAGPIFGSLISQTPAQFHARAMPFRNAPGDAMALRCAFTLAVCSNRQRMGV
jgi:hypothetical protein